MGERKKNDRKQKSIWKILELKLPILPTTTIGSFPQTSEVKQNRAKYRKGEITKEEYDALLKENQEIKKELQYVMDTTTKDMYLNDLNALNKTLKDDFVD
mgnify:CR=1 FL=1